MKWGGVGFGEGRGGVGGVVSGFFLTLLLQSVCFHSPSSPVVAAVTGAQMEKQTVGRKKLLFPFCLWEAFEVGSPEGDGAAFCFFTVFLQVVIFINLTATCDFFFLAGSQIKRMAERRAFWKKI